MWLKRSLPFGATPGYIFHFGFSQASVGSTRSVSYFIHEILEETRVLAGLSGSHRTSFAGKYSSQTYCRCRYRYVTLFEAIRGAYESMEQISLGFARYQYSRNPI